MPLSARSFQEHLKHWRKHKELERCGKGGSLR
jgi:hypothetical protein